MSIGIAFMCWSALAGTAAQDSRGAAATDAGASITIALPMEARVRGTEIELQEIARVGAADPAVVLALESLSLGYAPSPGFSRLITGERIAEALKRSGLPRAAELAAALVFPEQKSCRVFPEVLEVSVEEIRAAAQAELARSLLAKDAAYELAEPIATIAVPAGARRHAVKARVPADPGHSGTLTVPVEVIVDGVPYRTIFTSWRVELFHTLPVLARAVKAGATLSADMFERRRVEVDAARPPLALSVERLQGTVAKRDLAAGEVLTGFDVDRPTVVSAGRSVFLRVRKGNIEARVAAVALESGSVGDRIRVKTVESAQELVGAVRGRDLVELDLGG